MAKGDHIRVRRGMYWHHGIDRGDGTIIHYDGSPRRPNGTVSIVSRERFGRGRPIHVVCSCSPEEAEEVVERAESRLGEACYDLVSNNCEHFASWSATGSHNSHQVQRVVDTVALAATVAWLGLNLITRRNKQTPPCAS